MRMPAPPPLARRPPRACARWRTETFGAHTTIHSQPCPSTHADPSRPPAGLAIAEPGRTTPVRVCVCACTHTHTHTTSDSCRPPAAAARPGQPHETSPVRPPHTPPRTALPPRGRTAHHPPQSRARAHTHILSPPHTSATQNCNLRRAAGVALRHTDARITAAGGAHRPCARSTPAAATPHPAAPPYHSRARAPLPPLARTVVAPHTLAPPAQPARVRCAPPEDIRRERCQAHPPGALVRGAAVCLRSHTRTHMHARTHIHTHARTHTRTHAHTCVCTVCVGNGVCAHQRPHGLAM